MVKCGYWLMQLEAPVHVLQLCLQEHPMEAFACGCIINNQK